MYLADQVKSTPAGRRLYEREGLIFRVTEQIAAAMEERGIKKSELAERMNTTKSYITQLLNGSENMTLAKVAEVMLALGLRADITVSPLNDARKAAPREAQQSHATPHKHFSAAVAQPRKASPHFHSTSKTKHKAAAPA